MRIIQFKQELKSYYLDKADNLAHDFLQKTICKLNESYSKNREKYNSTFKMKILQYKIIAEDFQPIVFLHSPFYYETGTLCARSDGGRDLRGMKNAAGWTYWTNQHFFEEQDEKLWDLRWKQAAEQFYLICGPYNDDNQHFAFNHLPILEKGLKGVYEDALAQLHSAKTESEKEFLQSVCEGMLALKKMAGKFAQTAENMLQTATEEETVRNLMSIANTAKRVPWEKPETFYEALNMYAFMRKAIGALEGIGTNSFGRLDVDLLPFYIRDLQKGLLTKESAFELIKMFLLTWDLHYDHDMKMEGYADHELENTYVLGGCDENGEAVYNDLTEMFLRATREEQIIFPKIKCRFSQNSPKVYLDAINRSVVQGTSTILYQNDGACIPALVNAGRTLKEAREYIVTGCWGIQCQGVEKYEGGNYVNMLKPFEYSIHNLRDRMEKVGMYFQSLDACQSFDEVYNTTLENIKTLLEERVRITRLGGNILHKVDVIPIFSSTMEGCLANRKDYTQRGAKYNDEQFLLFGFPEIIDSLLAIKELCFKQKKYTLQEFLNIVRSNWEGNEKTRIEATRCHGWGDGNEESNMLAKKLNDDLYMLTQQLKGSYGGKVQIGYLTYTEVRWWGEKTLATPNGRKNGDYFAQGLTPSRLKKIPNATDVINSMANIDATKIAGNSVVNIILPSTNMTLDICESFLRAIAQTAVQSLQLNVVTKEELLDAQKHPEKYPHLIVRVTGFSAKFTALSPEWQKEVLTRNFYE